MPFPASKMKITFDEIDCPEYWCEFKTMSGMKYKEIRELFGTTSQDDPNEDYILALLKKMILSWNLPAEDGGDVLPIPAQDDDSINKLPNIVIQHLVEKISGTDKAGNEEDLVIAS